MASSNQLSLDTVKTEIEKIASLLQRNTKAVNETARRVLQLESGDRKADVADSRIPDDGDSDDGTGAGNANEVIGNDDIVQLVTELQDQLDLLDTRSIRRNANSFATADSDGIAALPGNDGLIPGENVSEEAEPESSLPTSPFPKTLGEFKSLPSKEIEAWLRYYELLPPDEEELRKLLSEAAVSSKDTEKLSKEYGSQGDAMLSTEEANGHFDTLARFLGLRARKTAGAW